MIYCPDQVPFPPNTDNKYWTLGSGVVGTAPIGLPLPHGLTRHIPVETGLNHSTGVAWDAQETPGYKYQVSSLVEDMAGNYQLTGSTNNYW